MGAWEEELKKRSRLQPAVYYRYIDDIFGVWEYTLQELQKFSQLANSIHPKIALTLRSDDERINFLDVNITLSSDNSIATQLFEKETNAYMYVHDKSNHPKATKENIAYGLALRSKRICSNEADYEQSKHKIEERLILRGHD